MSKEKQLIENLKEKFSSVPKILEKYDIEYKILGEGAHGIVLPAKNKKTGKKMVVKYTDLSLQPLQMENIIARKLGEETFFYCSGYAVGVFEYKGDSIDRFMKKYQFPSWFNEKKLFFSVLDELHHLHNIGYIYNDMSAGNVCISKEDKKVSLIDFGLCKSAYLQLDKIKKGDKTKTVEGTANFNSVASNRRHPIYFKDDIESLCYLVWYVFVGDLPWSKLIGRKSLTRKKYEELADLKSRSVCPLPRVENVLLYLKTIKQTDPFDYDYVKEIYLGGKIPRLVQQEEPKKLEMKDECDFTHQELKLLLKKNDIKGRSKLTTKEKMLEKLFEKLKDSYI